VKPRARKVYRAIGRAKLEPYLGFLHALQHGTPSLVCDLEELYRSLIDDFVISYCRNISAKDFILKSEQYSPTRKAKRQYLNEAKTGNLTRQLNQYFESQVTIPRIKRGQRQEVETLINEAIERDCHTNLSDFTRDALRQKIEKDCPELYRQLFKEVKSEEAKT
jgi:CRISPR/Cas system-associated endonuclease Cas1